MLLGYVYVETKINDGKQIISSVGHFDHRITKCNIPRESPEATGHGHWVTTHSVLPLRLPR